MERQLNNVGFVEIFKDTCRDFSEWTSIAGLSNANKSERSLSQSIWIVIFVIGSVATVYNVHSVITSYLSYPYSTKSDSIKHSSLEFPAVTICNQNRVSCHNLFDAMLEEIDSSGENSSLELQVSDYPLLHMYNKTQCGPRILTCEKVFSKYITYNFTRNEVIPELLLEHDVCITCDKISPTLEDVCSDWWWNEQTKNVQFERLKFSWKYLGCDEKLKDLDSIHHSSIEFPAITICYKGYDICDKLFNAMMEEVAKYNTNDSLELDASKHPLFYIYNATKCGPDILYCNEVILNYISYNFSKYEGIPKVFLEHDGCFQCSELEDAFTKACADVVFLQEPHEQLEKLLLAWKYKECDQPNLKIEYLEFPTLEFPRVNICYKNQLVCNELVDKIIIEYNNSKNENETTSERNVAEYPLFSLYLKTECGNKEDHCIKFLEKYIDFDFPEKDFFPSIFLENDKCFKCTIIISTFENACKYHWEPEPIKEKKLEKFNFLWKYMQCYQQNLNNATTSDNLFLNWSSCPPDPKQAGLQPPRPARNRARSGASSPVAQQDYNIPIAAILSLKADFADENQSLDYSMNYEALPLKSKSKIGYTFNQFILNCTFLQSPCAALQSEFIQIISPTYGVCQTFNFWGKEQSSIAGNSFSLHLHLNIDEDSYLPELWTTRQGVRIVIHPPRTIPALEEEGIDVPVNMATTILVKKSDHERLKAPYKPNCTSSWDETPFVLGSSPNVGNHTNLTHLIYSSEYCNRMCLQYFFIKACSCYHPEFPIGFWFRDVHHLNVRNCNFSSASDDMTCLFSLLNSTDKFKPSECECNTACTESAYQVSSSMCNWPSSHSEEPVKNYYKDFIKKVKGNLLQVDIFYSSMFVETHVQIPQYNGFADYISALGGALSLYLGISIVLIAEIFQFFCILGRSVFLYFLGKHHMQIKRQQTEKEVKLQEHKQKSETLESEAF